MNALPFEGSISWPGTCSPVVTEEKLRRARDLIATGLTVRDAAVRLKVGKTALYEALRQPLA